jgi:hypothetical protein
VIGSDQGEVVPVEQQNRGSLQECAKETIRAAAADLTEVAGRFPVHEAETDKVVAILERLGEECAEAAGMLRGAARPARSSPRSG